ncbi:MAG: RHS repeat-associated core domain-containing protein [Chlamydiales bacterium]|nr:RHS repeat-associated core domain-containing protein [Chlamydiales bacterium]
MLKKMLLLSLFFMTASLMCSENEEMIHLTGLSDFFKERKKEKELKDTRKLLVPTDLFFDESLMLGDDELEYELNNQQHPLENLQVDKNYQVSTGQAVFSKIVTLAYGKEAIFLPVYYSSKIRGEESGGEWQIMPHQYLKSSRDLGHKKSRYATIWLHDMDGSCLKFTGSGLKNDNKWSRCTNECIEGSNHLEKSELQSSNHLNYELFYNMKLDQYKLVSSNGWKRWYRACGVAKGFMTPQYWYVLDKEQRPSKSIVKYHYDTYNRLSNITCYTPDEKKTLSSAQFYYFGHPEKTRDFRVVNHYNENYYFRFRQVKTKKNNKFYLESITTPHEPLISFEYENKKGSEDLALKKQKIGSGFFLAYDYYEKKLNFVSGRYVKIKDPKHPRLDRVSRIIVPTGKGFISVSSLIYHIKKDDEEEGNYTEIIDALQNKMVYCFGKKNNLEKIKYYFNNGKKDELVKRHKLFWEINGRVKKNLGDVLFDKASNKARMITKTEYDDHHNASKIQVVGNITGDKEDLFSFNEDINAIPSNMDCQTKKLHYDHEQRNLLKRLTHSNGLIEKIGYHGDTNFKHFHLFVAPGGKILKRHFYFYDKYHFLEKEVVDDAGSEQFAATKDMTFRRTTEYVRYTNGEQIGLPEWIIEKALDVSTNQTEIIGKKQLFYNYLSQVVKECVYGSDGILAYTKHYDYNRKGLLTKYKDEFGYETIYGYDEDNYKIYEKNIATGLEERFFYDKLHRLIKKEQIGSKKLVQEFVYDDLSRLIKEIDVYGNVTEFYYEGTSPNPIEIIKPYLVDPNGKIKMLLFSYKYDIQGNKIKETTPEEFTTRYKYTIFNQIYRQTDPIGNITKRTYDLEGRLIKEITQDSIAEYKYDILGRKIYEERKDKNNQVLSSLKYAYKGDLVDQIVDHRGMITKFSYDATGRKTQEVHLCEGREQEEHYQYDTLGFLAKEVIIIDPVAHKQQITLYKNDVQGRILEVTRLDENSQVVEHSGYVYDAMGNKIEEHLVVDDKENTRAFIFDAFNQMLKKVDFNGAVTIYEYDYNHVNAINQRVLKKIATLPNGVKEECIFDAHGNTASLKKIDLFNIEIHKEEFFYDTAHHVICHKTFVYENSTCVRVKQINWAYDGNGNVLEEKEVVNDHDAKVTTYTYNDSNQTKQIIKPDGNTITFDYLASLNIKAMYSSDKTVHYEYSYDNQHRLTKVKDLVHQLESNLAYDAFDNITTEELFNNVQISREFDHSDRQVAFILPQYDATLSYEYSAFHLTKIKRKKGAYTLYEHAYTSFDELGRPMQEQLICNLGVQHTTYDASNRISKKESPFFTHEILSKDLIGNILSDSMNIHGVIEEKNYQYDLLNQLTEERGFDLATYQFDSNRNIVVSNSNQFTYNHLDQITTSSTGAINYDKNGNITLKQTGDNKHIYHYDAIGRLTTVETSTHTVEFIYDYSNRRMSKKVLDKTTNSTSQECYLYDGDHEIGSIVDNKLHQLKVNGRGYGDEIGATIAIEIDEDVYLPLTNIYGDITGLIDLDGNLIESYDFDSFGERKTSSQEINPWQYKSKRLDPETNLIFFSNRYYDPALKKFISTDPLGYQDIFHLYQFCLNNPLCYLDVFGLEVSSFIKDLFTPQVDPEYIKKFPIRDIPPPGTYLADFENDGRSEQSSVINVGRFDPIGGPLLYINGMLNTRDDCIDNLEYISRLGNGCRVTAVYNSTKNIFVDGKESWLGLKGVYTPPVEKVVNEIYEMYDGLRPGQVIKILPHSQGTILAYNAIDCLPKEIRDRIKILAIAPAKCFERGFVKWSKNIMSLDFVPLFQKGCTDIKFKDCDIEFIMPKKFTLWDHDFQSKTYKKRIRDFIKR